MKQICINCTPLINKITGIERCVYENIKRIDKKPEAEKISITLLYPEGTQPNFPHLYNLKKKHCLQKTIKLICLH